jgi:hypothetical protein
MPQNKKHHYVPKFYLKRFSSDKKSICLYNLPSELFVKNANLKNQCYQNYFYGTEKTTENALSEMEGEISKLYRVIDNNNSIPPSFSEHHVALTMSILIQHSRTKYQADALDEMNDKMLKHIFKEKIESELKGVNIDDFIIGIKDVANFSMRISVRNYPLLLDLRCKLLINNTGVEYITSDNPVVMFNKLLSFRNIGSNTGLSIKGLQIFFPISPNKLIIMYDDESYRVGNDAKNIVEVINEKDVYNMNALQACSCYENIYFKNPSQNVIALHNKVRPFLRKEKSDIKVFPGRNNKHHRSEYMLNFREDIRLNLNLSFLGIRKSAKEWRSSFQKLKIQPAAILRNENYHKVVEEFNDNVEGGVYEYSDFLKFMDTKFRRSN